jgi:hypothetical protein
LAIGLLLAAGPAVAQTNIDAAYVRGRVKELPKKKPGKLDVSDANVLKYIWKKGTWEVPFTQIKTIYILLSRRSAMVELGLVGAAGFAKKRKVLLSLSFADDQGKNRNCVFFLPAGSSREFLNTLETKVGREAVFESAEARKAIQGDW